MRVRNLTPHTIRVHRSEGQPLSFEPEGIVARVSVTRVNDHSISIPVDRERLDIDCYRNQYGPVLDLPDPQPDTILVVSAMVAAACPRPDVYSPGELVRDPDTGQPIGCKGLTASV